MSKVAHIVQATRPKAIMATLEELMDDLAQDRVTDFIVISRVKRPTDERHDGTEIKFSWMGRESCLIVLGLLDYMKTKVKDYIWDRQQ